MYTVLFLCSDSDLLWLSDLVWFFLFWERIGLILLSFNVVRMVKHCKEKMVGCVCLLMTAAVFFSFVLCVIEDSMYEYKLNYMACICATLRKH